MVHFECAYLVSSTHAPGLGSGTLLLGTGSQAEALVVCSLNFPSKAWLTASSWKVHTALPIRPEMRLYLRKF
jgi:hypothetical protein